MHVAWRTLEPCRKEAPVLCRNTDARSLGGERTYLYPR